ncbi:response regulator [Sulfuritalea hydrogenivorans]|uniref:Response regulator receiver protein n=1 Tax=Sulfuritalea hydrogenivorans sk43H TaxID=1223802 RepID=W0SEG6_9PROT|nr:response regulator [Sulfuritalea hydrogenivorans]BAO29629.1 response regulator receiver protein [Sulfuritalea hydrogenivorans sk43H]
MNKVLIVDDQDTIRKMLRLTLTGRYELFEAAEASEAWEIVRRIRPQAIILDIMMPGEMDGYQFCEKLKADRELRRIHVVMVTARGQEADRQKGIASGADAYFVKPFSPLALARHLEDALPANGDS